MFCRFTINLIIALNQLLLDLVGTSLSRYGKCGEREASSHVSPQLLWEKLMDMKDYYFFFSTTVILLIRADSGLFEGLTRLTIKAF